MRCPKVMRAGMENKKLTICGLTMAFYWFPPILGGNVCNQRCLSFRLVSGVWCPVSGVWCLVSVRNADISETIIARTAKFGMLILHVTGAKFVEGIFERYLRS